MLKMVNFVLCWLYHNLKNVDGFLPTALPMEPRATWRHLFYRVGDRCQGFRSRRTCSQASLLHVQYRFPGLGFAQNSRRRTHSVRPSSRGVDLQSLWSAVILQLSLYRREMSDQLSFYRREMETQRGNAACLKQLNKFEQDCRKMQDSQLMLNFRETMF